MIIMILVLENYDPNSNLLTPEGRRNTLTLKTDLFGSIDLRQIQFYINNGDLVAQGMAQHLNPEAEIVQHSLSSEDSSTLILFNRFTKDSMLILDKNQVQTLLNSLGEDFTSPEEGELYFFKKEKGHEVEFLTSTIANADSQYTQTVQELLYEELPIRVE